MNVFESKRATALFLFILISILYFHHPLFAADEVCLKENAEVNWVGTIHRTTFPGPPNYENIQKGDKPETYWILKLKKPVCIANEKALSSFQLIVDPTTYKNKKLLKENVRVEGTLMPQITGHHHTPYLIQVKSIVAAN